MASTILTSFNNKEVVISASYDEETGIVDNIIVRNTGSIPVSIHVVDNRSGETIATSFSGVSGTIPLHSRAIITRDDYSFSVYAKYSA